MDNGNANEVATEPPHNPYIAFQVTNMPQGPSFDDNKGTQVEITPETETNRRHVTQVEHTKINEAIAVGIAHNVDDFMVRILHFSPSCELQLD